VTGTTPVFKLCQGAPNLVPVTDADAALIDFENQTLNAGLVGAYSVGNAVWRDNNGDGVLGPGDSGTAGVTGDSNIDAGLTSPSNHGGVPRSDGPPVDAALSTAPGVGPQIAIVVLALAVTSASCLLVARRRKRF
jgi:hypothetical protein